LPPTDATVTAPDAITCSGWTFSGASGSQTTAPGATISGCSVSGITSNDYPNGFNGVLVDVKVNVPASYTCDQSVSTNCWFKIQMSYTNGAQANDTTTWGASIGGDPVRLVQ